MRPPKVYSSAEAAAAAFVRRGRNLGIVEVRGGGWWRVAGWRRPVQGLAVLAAELERRGQLRRLGDGRAELHMAAAAPGPVLTVSPAAAAKVARQLLAAFRPDGDQ